MDGLAIFVINLDRAPERMSETARQLDAADLPYSRISAVDGARLAPMDAEPTAMGRALLPGEIGCFQSHLNAAQAFLDSDAELGLVLEDDVVLGGNAVAVLEALVATSSRFTIWDVMNLGRPAKRWRTPVRASVWDRPEVLCHAHQFPVTTTAILWSRGGARMFLSQNSEMKYPVDVQLQAWVSETGRGLAFEEPPFRAGDAESTIYSGRKRSGTGGWTYFKLRMQRLFRVHFAAIRAQYKSGYPK